MNTLTKAMTGVGLSSAVGAGAYAAELAFMDPNHSQAEFMNCSAVPDAEARAECIETAKDPELTWTGAIQLGSLVTLAASSFLAFRTTQREVEGR